MDTTSEIAQLFVYPIKSCAGIALREAVLTETGLDLDRAWMLVDAQGEFVSQRELPRMALIQPQLKTYEMVLRAPGMLALHVQIDAVEKPTQVRVWDDTCAAYDMGDVAAQWFSDFLGSSHGPLRLVRFDPEHQRPSSTRWTQGVTATTQFADGFAVLVASEASLADLNARLVAAGHSAVGMERFRPNIVLRGVEAFDEDRLDILHISISGESPASEAQLKLVKPCARCPIPNIDPASAVPSPEVGDMLQSYRQSALLGGAITFGMNAIVLTGADHALRVGQRVHADYRFE